METKDLESVTIWSPNTMWTSGEADAMAKQHHFGQY